MANHVGSRAPQPEADDERALLLGWLSFYRDALRAKCADVTPEQLVERSVEPSRLSLLGLIRHMCEMERAYGSWPLSSGDDEFVWVWGEYEDGAEDDIDGSQSDVSESFATWLQERSKTDTALARSEDLGSATKTEHSLRWNLAKLIGEYARHCGHADLIRERIDGSTGV